MEFLKVVASGFVHRRVSKVAVLFCGVSMLLAGEIAVRAQVTSIPFTSVAVGLAPGTSAAVCTVGALNSIGDGCPGTQAKMTSTYASWTDQYGNVYFVDYSSSYEVRVLYRGGATLAKLIAINNPTVTAPQVGYVYAIAGSYTRGAKTITTGAYCNGTSGAVALDSAGNGCPGYLAYTFPTGGYTDADGDVYLADHIGSAMIRVLYAGGAAAAQLIQLETGVTSPVVGSIYRIGGPTSGVGGYTGDGGLATSASMHNPHTLIVDASGNVYIADTANNAVRKISISNGYISTIAGAVCTTGTTSPYGCTAGYTGDSNSASGAELNAPYELAIDANNNIFIADSGNNRIRVIYAAGTLPGISNPSIGNIYTVVGGGSSTASSASALSLSITTPYVLSFDPAGNLYVGTYNGTRSIYRVNMSTGLATLIAGDGSATWTVGAYCNGGSSGPKATDTVGDGCPSTQSSFRPMSRLNFSPSGVAYVADIGNSLVRAFTFNSQFPATAVGSSSTIPIAVTSAASFAAPSITATVQGSSTSEFSGDATDCTAGTSYTANTVCTYSLQFTPALPGRRTGAYVLTQSGTTVATQGLEGDGQAPLLAVGSGTASSIGASIANAQSVTADALENLYISDTSAGTLWKMVGATGTPSAILTGLSQPAQSAVDGVGNIYVADSGNNRVVELTTSGNTVALLTSLSGPKGVAVTGNGVLYVADTGNNRILSYSQGALTQLPITGLKAPSALALDASDNLFIADTGNQRIVEYAKGIQSTVSFGLAGIEPVGIAVDPAGDLYVADALSGSVLLQYAGTSSTISLATGLASPSGISLDAGGNLFYADSSVAGFNEIVQEKSSITFAATNQNLSSTPATASIANIGNASLTFTSSPGYTATGDTSDFSLSAGSSGCGTATVASAATCTLQATFTPLASNLYKAAVTFQTNAANTSTAVLNLAGQGINLTTTATAITYSPSSLVYGDTATFTVTITPASGTVNPTGSITVTIDGAQYKTISVSGTTATFTALLASGTHAIIATYSGDGTYASSYGSTFLTVAPQPTTTALKYSLSTSTSTLTLTAQVTPGISGVPTGTISFYSGSDLIGTAALSNGVATYATTTVVYSSYTFSAQYSGDTNYAASTSASVVPTATFAITQAGTTLTTVAGLPISTVVTLKSYFNYSGTLTFSCSGLPANAVCRFQPVSVSLAGGDSTTSTVEVFTDVSTGAQASGIAGGKRIGWGMLLSLFVSIVLFYRMAIMRKRFSYVFLPVLLLVSAMLCGVTGCGASSANFAPTTTPAGTSTVVLTVSDSAGNSQTATYTLTVTQQ